MTGKGVWGGEGYRGGGEGYKGGRGGLQVRVLGEGG